MIGARGDGAGMDEQGIPGTPRRIDASQGQYFRP